MIEPRALEVAAAPAVCIVIPCYNEAHRLNPDCFRQFVKDSAQARLLFVDDGSSDNTLAVLQELRLSCEDHVSILTSERNNGKAEAVRRGILHAIDMLHSQIVGFWDADLATPLDAVDRFLQVLACRSDIEMVFGARVKLLGRHVERRAVRHYLGRIFATTVSTMLRTPIYDTQCGAKLFRVRPETRSVFAEPFLSRWVFDVEIIARYLNLWRSERKADTAVYEYPLETWVDIAGSKVHVTDFFTAFWDILRIRRKYLAGYTRQ